MFTDVYVLYKVLQNNVAVVRFGPISDRELMGSLKGTDIEMQGFIDC